MNLPIPHLPAAQPTWEARALQLHLAASGKLFRELQKNSDPTSVGSRELSSPHPPLGFP